MKERGMMSHLQRLILHPLTSKIFLCLLAIVYLGYLATFGRFLYTSISTPSGTIAEHQLDTNSSVIKYWTVANMRDATDADQLNSNASDLRQESLDTSTGRAVQQPGQPPRNENPAYPLSDRKSTRLNSSHVKISYADFC